jgi:hypothetical protein
MSDVTRDDQIMKELDKQNSANLQNSNKIINENSDFVLVTEAEANSFIQEAPVGSWSKMFPPSSEDLAHAKSGDLGPIKAMSLCKTDENVIVRVIHGYMPDDY